ncbi:MAG TPA: chemotaxis protein CheB [Longimicrobiaceae bacterium]|jgi:two-component system chemotaxis response regulator CheB|nr:chemotaxis protein CheB [Longimicrobiaceae bacterium]
MPNHDVIVIGGSAGGVEALAALAAGLPADLPAAVCAVIHHPAYMPSRLPAVLGRAGPLPAVAAADGMPLRPGVIHVAVPDQHLLVEASGRRDGHGVIRLTRGPRENRSRPAVDPLFRSAALAYGPRVIGVVLSGALDDGTAGLWEVRDRGGLAVVQDPADCALAAMPASALAQVGADHVATAREMGALLGRLALLPAPPALRLDAELEREAAIAAMDEEAHRREARYGVPSRFPCPDCGGVLWDTSLRGGPLRFRCETGHAYGPATLAEGQAESVEAALWASLRALEDQTELARVRQERALLFGHARYAEQLAGQMDTAQEHAAALRAVLRLRQRPAHEMANAPAAD